MDRSHRPIVAAAIQVLGERAGKVLDLGCGNGALLGKIVCGRSQLTAVGIDLNPDAIEHASLLQCGSASIFKTGNFFDCRLWTSSGNYALALLMIGRLLEASPDQSAALIKAIKGSCRDLLVYVYPGWSDQTFLELVERAGLKLSSAPYPNVGLVELNHNSFHLCGSLGDNLKT
jgi:SAM-dependent methyltransferase